MSSPRSGGIERKQRNSKSTMITLCLHFSQLLSSWTHFSKKGGKVQMLEKTFINKSFKLQRQLAPCLFLTSEFHSLSFPDNLLLKFSSLQGWPGWVLPSHVWLFGDVELPWSVWQSIHKLLALHICNIIDGQGGACYKNTQWNTTEGLLFLKDECNAFLLFRLIFQPFTFFVNKSYKTILMQANYFYFEGH